MYYNIYIFFFLALWCDISASESSTGKILNANPSPWPLLGNLESACIVWLHVLFKSTYRVQSFCTHTHTPSPVTQMVIWCRTNMNKFNLKSGSQLPGYPSYTANLLWEWHCGSVADICTRNQVPSQAKHVWWSLCQKKGACKSNSPILSDIKYWDMLNAMQK